MIFDMLKEHQKRELVSFHMPGHKNGAGFAGTAFESHMFALDTTELCDTDALTEPKDVLLEAERRAAGYYGAAHSFYLVNGSTSGILAMFYACFHPGDLVLIDRNCHRSVINAMALTGVVPVYMTPDSWGPGGTPCPVTPEAVTALLSANPAAKGVFVTSPSYYGSAADLGRIAKAAHESGAVLLVDEAHGAHFPFSKAFPPSALTQGADMSVTSLHKSLPSPNQGALLHMGPRFSVGQIREAVGVFQTSSPSYVLLAAMEYALAYAEKQGEQKTKWVLAQLEGLLTLDDPFKRLLLYGERGYSGYEVDVVLREKFGIYAELCDVNLVLLMASWSNRAEDFMRLNEAVRYLDSLPDKGPLGCHSKDLPAVSSELAATPGEVRLKDKDCVFLRQAEGRICGCTVAAFPPCIPVLLPGERISQNHIDLLLFLEEQGARITGLSEGRVFVLA